MRSGRNFYCNTLFDLDLGGFPAISLRRTATEMSILFIPLAGPGDNVLLDAEPCAGYTDYLAEYGLGIRSGKSVSPPEFLADSYIAWGRSINACDRFGRKNRAALNWPEFTVVRSLNNRKFCWELGREYTAGVPDSRYCTAEQEIAGYVNSHADQFPLVVKSAFGGFGYGIHRCGNVADMEEIKPHIRRYLAYGGLVIEPWLDRVTDVSTAVRIDGEGAISEVTIQQQRINRFGVFYGIETPADTALLEKWGTQLSRKTVQYAQAAARIGYRGPFGCDSFITRTSDGEQVLIFGVEVNARFTMGIYAHCIRKLLGLDTFTMLRFISRKKCSLPTGYNEWMARSASVHYNTSDKTGVLLLTPLQADTDGSRRQPQRSAFLISGETREDVERLDHSLQELIGKQASVNGRCSG